MAIYQTIYPRFQSVLSMQIKLPSVCWFSIAWAIYTANVTNTIRAFKYLFSIHDVSKDRLVIGYHFGYEDDLRHLDHGYLSTAKEVSIFLRALNEGTFFSDKEKQIYTSLYEYEHTGWVLGYQSIARYHGQEDIVVIQFVSTTGNDVVILTGILYDRIIQILRSM